MKSSGTASLVAPARASSAPPAPALRANVHVLLGLLRASPGSTRQDLARLSGLSRAAVTAAIAQLSTIGLVETASNRAVAGSRSSEQLVFVPRRAFVAAADIGGTRIRMRLADLAGTEVAAWSAILRRDERSPEAVCRRIDEGLKACCHAARVPRRKLLHLTAGAPGVTNARAGVVLAAPNLTRWVDVPLRDLLAGQLRLPVAIENDTNLAALGEYYSGVAQGIDDFVFLALGTGLGSGLVLRGQLYPGAHWSAGEVGYLGAQGQAREAPRLRETGSLERLVGGGGIEERWRSALEEQNLGTPARHRLRATGILDLAQAGDPVAQHVLADTAALLARAITDLALVLDPALVVLGGGIGSHPAIREATEACLGENELARPRLRSSALGAAAQLAGAVALSLAEADTLLLA